jgi:hypothetical protein
MKASHSNLIIHNTLKINSDKNLSLDSRNEALGKLYGIEYTVK